MSETHPQITPLVVAFTPNYIIPAATCLLSILKSSHIEDRYHVICLLSEELSSVEIEKLKGIDSNNQLTYTFLDLKGKLNDVYVDQRYTIAASYRLLLPDLLPEYDKVLYLDCDIIVRNNLAQLYHTTNLENNYLGAVLEASLDFQEANIRKLGCKPGEYFNSGFLLMNLQKMREDGMVNKFLDGLKVDYLEFPDQDVLNIQCRNKVLPLPPHYNSIRTFYLPQYKKFFLQKYSEKEWKEVQKHGNIHYTGEKPWNTFTVEFDKWWQMFWQLPETVRKDYAYNKKMNALSRFYSLSIGKFAIESARKLYRLLKLK